MPFSVSFHFGLHILYWEIQGTRRSAIPSISQVPPGSNGLELGGLTVAASQKRQAQAIFAVIARQRPAWSKGASFLARRASVRRSGIPAVDIARSSHLLLPFPCAPEARKEKEEGRLGDCARSISGRERPVWAQSPCGRSGCVRRRPTEFERIRA